MAKAVVELAEADEAKGLDRNDWLALLLDREITWRRDKRLTALLRAAASNGHSYECSSGPPEKGEASQLHFPRSGPDGQPIASSQLATLTSRATLPAKPTTHTLLSFKDTPFPGCSSPDAWSRSLGLRLKHHHSEGQPPTLAILAVPGPLRHLARSATRFTQRTIQSRRNRPARRSIPHPPPRS